MELIASLTSFSINAWRHERGPATSQLSWSARTIRLEQCLVLPTCQRGRSHPPSSFRQRPARTTWSSCKSVAMSIQNFQQRQWPERHSSEGLYRQATRSSPNRLCRPCLCRNRFGTAFSASDQKRNGDWFGDDVMQGFDSGWVRVGGLADHARDWQCGLLIPVASSQGSWMRL